MSEGLLSHFIDLVQDALLKSFWRKNSLINFLRRHKISESFIGTWQETETKRAFVTRLLPKLEAHAKADQIIKQMAASLSDQVKFPDLEGWEDSAQKIQQAREAVAALRQYLDQHKRKADENKAREEIRKETQERLRQSSAKQQSLDSLSGRLGALAKNIGTPEAGYGFQTWFYDLVAFFEIENRRPYSSNGRQIDGSLTLEGTTYLVELKFTREPSGATNIDSLLAKVNDKADNTMGIMVSMSGYSSPAVQQASGRKTPLLLMDFNHVYLALGGTWSLTEIIARIRRHASQTGQPLLSAQEFAM